MSDKVIRISSQQGFSDVFGAELGPPTNLNLLDFTIPRGMVVDLSKSYIAFNTSVSVPTVNVGGTATGWDGTEPINTMLTMSGMAAGNIQFEVPNVALIKNASIMSDRHGQIESLRRVDTLKSALWNLEHDAEERKDDMNAFTGPKGLLGTGNQSSYFLESCVESNDNNDAAIPGATSRQLARDVKVPLKDIFGICSADDWSTDKHGETRMHFETNWNKVEQQSLGGQEDVSVSFDETNTWGACAAVGPLVAAASSSTLELSYTYVNPAQECPFFVGQRILVKATNPAGQVTPIPPAGISVVISAMTTGNPGLGKMTITTATPFVTNDINPAGAGTWTDVTIEADNSYAVPCKIAVNRAELVLFTINDGQSTSDEYNFVSYTLDQDNGNGITSFSRGYVVEPSAVNFFCCLCPNGTMLPMTEYTSYRYAIDNVEQTGNRSVTRNSPIQYDRLTRCLDVASPTTEWRNAQLAFFRVQPNTDATPTQATSYTAKNTIICETMTATPSPKYLDLQVETAGAAAAITTLGDILIYKQHLRTL